MTKATHKKTTVDVIKQHTKAEKRQAGMGRQQASGVSAASAGTTSLVQSSQGSSAGSNTGDSLKISGGSMNGPLAFWGVGATISSGVINISSSTNSYSSRIIVTAESIPDDLTTITGANNSGQLLFLQVVNGHTVVLKQHTGTSTGGNINIPGGSDFTVNSQDIVLLQWDTTNVAHSDYGGQWTLVSSSGSGANNPATADLNMATWNIINNDSIKFDNSSAGDPAVAADTSIRGNNSGMYFNIPTGDTYGWTINDQSKLVMTNTTLTSSVDIVGASGEYLGISVIPWEKGFIDEVILGGATKGITNAGVVTFVNNTQTPAANGTIFYDGTDLKAQVSAGVVNLTSGGSSANQQLSNLSGTIAINDHLLPDDTVQRDLGSSSKKWRYLYAGVAAYLPYTAWSGNLDCNAMSVLDAGKLEFCNDSTDVDTTKAGLAADASGDLHINVATGDYMRLRWGGSTVWEINHQNITGPGIILSGHLTLQNAGVDPNANGIIRMNGTDVKVYSGGAVRNMSDIGSGSGGWNGNATSDLNMLGYGIEMSATGSGGGDIDMDGGDIHDVDHIVATTIDCTTIDTYNAEVDNLQMGGDIDMNGNDINECNFLHNVTQIRVGANSAGGAWSASLFETDCNITALYSGTIKIGQSNDNVGFFGATSVGKQTIPSNATLAQVVTALRNLGLGS